ncbi:MAG: MGMT family protein [Undibacterium sp.]
MPGPSKKSYRDAEQLSSFQRAVYAVVAKIPRGRVMTYAAVALQSGHPRAARAVGTAMSENGYRDVPCHRVVRTDGKIGEYAFVSL